MYKISIIVPIYNVEEFIEKSLNSILNQTMDLNEIEVILVDDCSTDNSGNIAKKYAENYDNIKYYCLSENSQMAGKPRNIGISMASGKYIMFLDPDDFFMPNACELMYNEIEKQNVNFVTSNVMDVDVNGNDLNRIHIDMNTYPSQKINIKDVKKALTLTKHYCPAKIVSKEFILKNDIKFLEGVPAEDAYFTSKMLLISKEAYYLSTPIVCYRRRSTSETNNLNETYFLKTIEANKEIYHLFKEYGEHTYYQYYYIDTMKYLMRQLILSDKLSSNEKYTVLENMKELISHWKNSGLPVVSDVDSYNILKLFEKTSKEETINNIKISENKMKKDDITTIRKNERKLIEYINKFIK